MALVNLSVNVKSASLPSESGKPVMKSIDNGNSRRRIERDTDLCNREGGRIVKLTRT